MVKPWGEREFAFLLAWGWTQHAEPYQRSIPAGGNVPKICGTVNESSMVVKRKHRSHVRARWLDDWRVIHLGSIRKTTTNTTSWSALRKMDIRNG
jgi:hypothetical protein